MEFGGIHVNGYSVCFEWIKNLSHIRFGRMQNRYEEQKNELLIEAIQKKGNKLSKELTMKILEGAEEVDLVRSGLDDTMRMAYQEVRERFWSRDDVPSFRIAAMAIAIEKIANTVQELGVYP